MVLMNKLEFGLMGREKFTYDIHIYVHAYGFIHIVFKTNLKNNNSFMWIQNNIWIKEKNPQ